MAILSLTYNILQRGAKTVYKYIRLKMHKYVRCTQAQQIIDHRMFIRENVEYMAA